MKRQFSIVIDDEHKDKINDFLSENQKRCKVRLVNYDDIKRACNEIKRKLDLPLYKMRGVVAYVDLYAQIFPSAYKWTPESTHFKIKCDGKTWKLLHVYRTKVNPSKQMYELIIPDEVKENIIKNLEMFR